MQLISRPPAQQWNTGGGNTEKIKKKHKKVQDTLHLHNNGTKVRGGNTEKIEIPSAIYMS